MRPRLIQFAPGCFARIGERRIVDGHTYRFTRDGWVHDVSDSHDVPAELRTRRSAGDKTRAPAHNANWTALWGND